MQEVGIDLVLKRLHFGELELGCLFGILHF